MKMFTSVPTNVCLIAMLGESAAFQSRAIGRSAFFQRPIEQKYSTASSLSVSASANMFAQVAMNDTAAQGSWIIDRRGMSSDYRPASPPISTVSASTIHQHAESSSASTSVDQQVHSIESMEELLQVMNGQSTGNNLSNDVGERLTLVKYYADYCKLCQRAGIQMKRLPAEFPTVDFWKVEHKVMTAPSAKTLRSLGVTKFPWIQIYRHGVCVASFSTGPSHIFMKKIRDTLNLCLERESEGWDEFYNEFSNEIAENIDTRQQLADSLN